MWGAAPGATTTAVVHKGQLVVDLIDARQRKIAWRGIAQDNLSDNRSKLVTQINTAVEKMFKKYPVPRASRTSKVFFFTQDPSIAPAIPA
jgi:Domain of unknown function (DUF4136)